MDVATRRQTILGTTQFPNPLEHVQDHDISVKPENIELLIPYRGSEAFEEIRLKTDAYAEDNVRPIVWMFTYGNLAMRKARSQFAGNFFGCAGFSTIDNPGFSNIDEGIKAATKAKPSIVVICSSDEEYTDIVEPIFEALKDHSIIVLAGYPKDMIDQLKSIGLNNFIHIKSNVLDELKRYQQMLNIG